MSLLSDLNDNLRNAFSLHYNLYESNVKFQENWSSSNIFKRYIKSIYLVIKRVITYWYNDDREYRDKINHCKVLLYTNSLNTYNSLTFLSDLKCSEFFLQANTISHISKQSNYLYKDVNRLEIRFKTPFWIVILMLINYPIIALRFRLFLLYPDFYFENWAKDFLNKRLLSKANVQLVVFANDHNPENRLFLIAANELNIKTCFLQHAAVSRFSPSLDTQINFLFGEKDKYSYELKGKMAGDVFLVGSPKFDTLYPYRKNSYSLSTVGISTNSLDNFDNLNMLISSLIEVYDVRVILRTHPDDFRKIEIQNEKVIIQRGNEVPIIDYLREIDIHIAGNTSVHVEALYLNIPSFYYYSSPSMIKDRYGFNNFFRIEEFSIDKLKSCHISDYPKKLIASMGESYDGHVSRHIKEILSNYIELV